MSRSSSEAWVRQDSLTTQSDRQLGFGLAVDGPRAVVTADRGAPTFERVNGQWLEIEPIPLAGEFDTAFSVAASDGTVALLIETFLENVGDHSELWFCHRESPPWACQRKLSDLDLNHAEWLSLSPSLLVLSRWSAGGGHDVLAFDRSGEELGASSVVLSTDSEDFATFAVSGSEVLVGLQYAAGGQGLVKAFSRHGDAWQFDATLSAPGSDVVGFGLALAATPDRVIAGTATGEAYVFDHTGDGFSKPVRVDTPDRSPRPVASLAVSAEAALVGFPASDVEGAPGAGVAYIAFAHVSGFSASQWLTPDHVRPDLGFGQTVALAEGEALVTAPGDTRPQGRGRVFVYGACESDRDCAPGSYCSVRGTCASQKAVAEMCDATLDCREAGCRVCESLHCADGFCCDSACDGQCQACAEPGSEGSCRAVAGQVRGQRAPCDTDKSQCGGTCDGESPACSFPAPGTPCASQCSDGILTPSSCDGVGSCASGKPRACGGYACDGDACAVTCRRSEDCVRQFACLNQTCVPLSKLACSEDGSSSMGPSGTSYCAPYRCDTSSGVCRSRCRAADDCDSGYVCDVERRTCTLESQLPTTGGCGCRLGHANRAHSWFGSAALLLASWLRRRRRRRRAA